LAHILSTIDEPQMNVDKKLKQLDATVRYPGIGSSGLER
jgi:hypothetical protein